MTIRDMRPNVPTDTKSKKIPVRRFSILRLKKRLEGPRVAGSSHTVERDKRNHNSDELSGKFTIYPLASEND